MNRRRPLIAASLLLIAASNTSTQTPSQLAIDAGALLAALNAAAAALPADTVPAAVTTDLAIVQKDVAAIRASTQTSATAGTLMVATKDAIETLASLTPGVPRAGPALSIGLSAAQVLLPGILTALGMSAATFAAREPSPPSPAALALPEMTAEQARARFGKCGHGACADQR
jgi:hypothetical protein